MGKHYASESEGIEEIHGTVGKESKFKLVLIKAKAKGLEYPLFKGENFVGRWDSDLGSFPEIDLEPHDPEALVSRRHAVMRVSAGELTVEDLGSMNGTYLNRGKRLERNVVTTLKIGDEIVFGKTFLKVQSN